MKYYLGVDIGTTSTKAVAFSEKAEELFSHAVSYAMHHPQPGRSEQDPDEIVLAVVNCLRQVFGHFKDAPPDFISFSAAMHSLILLDHQDHPLTPCIIWADNRADEIATRLRKDTGMKFYNITGVPIHPMSPLCKMMWFKEHQPQVYKSTRWFIGIKEYVFLKLFNERILDTSLASATGLLNLHTLEWDPEILSYLQIDASKLFQLVAPTYVFKIKTFGNLLNMQHEIPIVTGASDGALASLASGHDRDALTVSIGTSAAVRMLLTNPGTDAGMKTFCYHVKDDQYVAGGASNNGGVVLQWLKESLFESSEEYETLVSDAMNVQAAANALFCLPYIFGERAPIWNSKARGVFIGLGIEHQKPHLVRAAIEGILFCLYSIALPLIEKKNVSRIYVSGGFARNEDCLQLLADIFNLEVCIPSTVEASAFGAALVGTETLDLSFQFEKTPRQVFIPDREQNRIYVTAFKKWSAIYEKLKQEW